MDVGVTVGSPGRRFLCQWDQVSYVEIGTGSLAGTLKVLFSPEGPTYVVDESETTKKENGGSYRRQRLSVVPGQMPGWWWVPRETLSVSVGPGLGFRDRGWDPDGSLKTLPSLE